MNSLHSPITDVHLRHLYLKKKLSTSSIAKIYGCNHVTILNYLKKYNIPRRSKLGNRESISIEKDILNNLYHNEKMTQEQIAHKFGHSRYGIQRWMKIYNIRSRSFSETNTKYPKFDFDGDLNDKSYLIGFRLGDLNVYKVHNLIQVRCSTTIEAQAILIKNLFKKYGNVHIWKAKRGTLEIIALLNKSFEFLFPKQDLIETWIIKDKEYFISFLAGYADAEGSYYLRKPYKLANYDWGVFEIQTYDKNIIYTIHEYLMQLGIKNIFSKSRQAGHIDKRGIKTNKDCWRITIVRKQFLWKFIKLVEHYHKHTNKIKELRIIKDNLVKRNTLPYCKPIIL